MNWGKGIVIVMASFIIFITVLVVKLISADVDLESDDYYAREINYGAEMQAVQNAEDLDKNIVISSTSTHLTLQVPEVKEMQDIVLNLKRIDNEKLDRSFKIEGTKTFLVDKKELVKGIYKIELYYTIKGVLHMQKEQIYI